MDLFYNKLDNYLGANNNGENLKLLEEGIRQLPSNLEGFELYLSDNRLGYNADNLMWLGEGMRYLS